MAVADRNAWSYCLAAHAALSRKARVSAADMAAAQAGQSSDPKTAAALRFPLKVVNERGQVGDADVHALRNAGLDDEHTVEILSHVALNLFTKNLTVAFDVPIDFPSIKLRAAV